MIIFLFSISTLMSPGKPRVPVIRELIQGDTIGITILIEYAESTAKEVIPPAPYPVRKGTTPRIPYRDPLVYEKDAFFPATPYSFFYLGRKRGVPYYILEVHPYQYNPIKNKIRYAEKIDIKKSEKSIPITKNGKDTLLIVAPEGFFPTMKDFIFYKRLLDFTVDTLIVQPSWDTTRIREEILQRVPDYLLLVGDVSQIPAFYRTLYMPEVGNDPRYTDLYYACVDSDFIPDMYYGRMSVGDTIELRDILNKIIGYDSLAGYWKGRAFFMASNDSWYHTLAEETQIYSMERARASEMTVDSNFAYYPQYAGTPLDFAFSGGRSIAAYSGHGGTYSWNGPNFNLNDIQNLPSNQRTPIIFSFACFTGSYQVDDCFMEEWNKLKGKGSVLSFGSSTYSYWDEDDIFQRRIFDVLFSGLSIGAVIDTSKLLFARDYTGDPVFIESYHQQYNLFGDPTQKVKTGSEEKTLLDLPTICSVDDTITVSTYNNGKIGLVQGDREMIVDADFTGKASIPLSGFVAGELMVMAAERNALTTTGTIHLSPEPLEDIFEVVPNPIIGTFFNLHFFAIKGEVMAHLYDILGRQREEKRWVYQEDDTRNEEWNVSNLPGGIYFLEVHQGNLWRFTRKIIKL